MAASSVGKATNTKKFRILLANSFAHDLPHLPHFAKICLIAASLGCFLDLPLRWLRDNLPASFGSFLESLQD